MTKAGRIAHANAAIDSIAARGRRFFAGRDGSPNARFEIGPGGRVHFVDDWTKASFPVTAEGEWPKFSHGGTLRALVQDLAGYVEDGIPVPAERFGPWHKSLARGDLWGYGSEAMASLRSALAGNPAIARRQADSPEA